MHTHYDGTAHCSQAKGLNPLFPVIRGEGKGEGPGAAKSNVGKKRQSPQHPSPQPSPLITGEREFESRIRAGRLAPGMSFNQKVWALTSRIPAGSVTTYGEIARALGSPRAGRAVGNALNRNPYAPGVPCHRVVGSNGSLTGYAGGLEKKRKMLAAEGIALGGKKVDVSQAFRFGT
jgi:O-6-methylguanine DNA methyltransferase